MPRVSAELQAHTVSFLYPPPLAAVCRNLLPRYICTAELLSRINLSLPFLPRSSTVSFFFLLSEKHFFTFPVDA